MTAQAATPYKPPSTPLFTILPSSWIPYAELMRLDRPDGFYAFYWHYAIGLGFAACLTAPPPTPSTLLSLSLHLALWTLLLRGITCTWNDNLDQEFDRRVTRTKNRPIARGAVSTMNAHIFTLLLIGLAGAVLVPLSREAVIHALGITVVLMIYPLGKRFTDFPQVILGVGFAMPVFMCCAVLGMQISLPFPWTCYTTGTGTSGDGVGDGVLQIRAFPAAAGLFLVSLLWTVIFDTVYAHQDVKDDVKAGVRSLAVLLGGWTKAVLSVLAAGQVMLLLWVGVMCQFSVVYFVLGCGGAGGVLASMLWLVKLDRPASCAWWFGPGSKLVGACLVAGFWGEYLVRSDMAGLVAAL
ncbi:UbiA prenyltransferase family-domain-containing protein [Aspergillus cavernicola]|uniref:UbiA prenyltransferase family-domain-containing protein n=1 Tax=Aspergillus cavernicola TaxID=176166 RepID=A0ABR4HZE5_9EURO